MKIHSLLPFIFYTLRQKVTAMKKILLLQGLMILSAFLYSQNVGIGTTNPLTKLHVKGDLLIDSITGGTPVSGAGTRLMWIPSMEAFRAGRVTGAHWDADSIGLGSVALGGDTKAKGWNAFAMGGLTSANGDFSSSFGFKTTSSGTGSVAVGVETTASAGYSVAMGHQTKAINSSAVALGFNTTAAGISSTAMGHSTKALGGMSAALGFLTIANGWYSIAAGGSTQANADYSIAAGTSNISKSWSGTVVGSYNDTSYTPNPTNPHYLNRLFEIGNGTGSNARSNAMTVLQTGFVGIGTTTPLEVLHVIGNICYAGSINACSDMRYKKNIQPVTNALNNLLLIHGIYYNWDKEKFSDKGFGDERQIGFSAQEVEKLFPEIVKTDINGYKSIDYTRLTPILVEAVKEQQSLIENQNKKIEQLQQQSQNNELAKKIELQQQQINKLLAELQLIREKLK